MRTHRIRVSITVALIALAASLSACASATKRYEQGREEEQNGRPADAARRYIDALKKDPTYSEARQRLLDVGARAVADDSRAADALESTGAEMDAADALRHADDLIRDAANVGVSLDLPMRYAERHEITFSKAVDQAVAQAWSATQRHDYSESVRLVERARDRWQPRLEQQSALNAALREAHLLWGRSEMSAGRFRSAYSHGESARLVPGFDGPAPADLMSEAIARGTLLVAVFPAGARTPDANRLLPEVNDLLTLDYWQRPPRWIELVNPIESQRLARNRGFGGRDISARDVGALTRQLNARYGVSLTLDSVRYSESKVEKQRHTARTRAGKDTAFTVESGQLETWVRVGWREVDPGGSVIEHGEATNRATTQFKRATYVGNWRDLDLGSSDRGLFDQRDPRDDQETFRRLARGLAEKLGGDIFDALLRRVD